MQILIKYFYDSIWKYSLRSFEHIHRKDAIINLTKNTTNCGFLHNCLFFRQLEPRDALMHECRCIKITSRDSNSLTRKVVRQFFFFFILAHLSVIFLNELNLCKVKNNGKSNSKRAFVLFLKSRTTINFKF